MSKFNPKWVRIDFVEQLQDLIPGEIDMVLHRHLDAVVFGDLDGLLEHLDQGLDLRTVRFVAEHQAAADHAHHVRADGLGLRDHGDHLLVGGPVLAALQTIRVTPGVDPVQLIVIQLGFEVLEPGRRRPWTGRSRTSSETPSTFSSLARLRKSCMVISFAGGFLIRVDLAEEPVVAIAIDSDFHFCPPENYAGLNNLLSCQDEPDTKSIQVILFDFTTGKYPESFSLKDL